MAGKRRVSILLTAALMVAGLTGCAENQIPDLSQEEIQAVGEFVAVTMMKYDINHRSRLMDLTQADADYMESLEEDPSATPEPEETTGMPPVDDTPVVNAPEGTSGGEGTAVSSYKLEEVMGLPEGLEVTFTEQQICDHYPEEEDFFSLNASEGKKLLVLQFQIANAGGQEQSVDMLASDVVFNITVNDTYTRRALTTMLLNDMATYVGTVPAGGSIDAVLVIEVEAETAEAISSCRMNVKKEEKACALELF